MFRIHRSSVCTRLLTKISYPRSCLDVRFIHDSCLCMVQLRKVSFYFKDKRNYIAVLVICPKTLLSSENSFDNFHKVALIFPAFIHYKQVVIQFTQLFNHRLLMLEFVMTFHWLTNMSCDYSNLYITIYLTFSSTVGQQWW